MLLAALTFVVAAWLLRYAWARLTGRSVTPFVMRVDPRAGFATVWRRAPSAAPSRPQQQEIGDVTDVEAKPPRM